MKAELTDGSIITLDGPCEAGCITHTGPHWVQSDALHRRMNRRFLEGEITAGKAAAFATAEIDRLREKRYQMESRGIVRLIQDGNE